MLKVIISNGSNRFHLSVLAKSLSNFNYLYKFYTAGYPNWILKKIFKIIKVPASLRFLDRAADNIPEKYVSSDNISEFVIRIACIFLIRISQKTEQYGTVLAMKIYSFNAAFKILFSSANVYHYRNCYGGISVKVAKLKGMQTFCDHSIAHPFLIDYMTNNDGLYPNNNELKLIRKKLFPLYKRMNSDLLNNDTIIVNSDFVKESLIYCGIDKHRIKVVYLGVDDVFLNYLEKFNLNLDINKNKILFAGGIQKRKGILNLLNVLFDSNIILDIAGGIDIEIKNNELVQNFFKLSNVNYLGNLSRIELANLMSNHRIFVFPSHCEGSARVIFEALAAGLFIITTENSGSIVKHMVHGYIVKPGNEFELITAINWAINNRVEVDKIRLNNFNSIRSYYKQKMYAENILSIYKN